MTEAPSQTEWVNNIPSPSDGGGLGWGCFRSEQTNNIGESPQEKTYRCRASSLEALKNETDGRFEIQKTTAHRQLHR